jgi:hypothetical protein
MALSIEEHQRIREDEWIRALARQDFERQYPRPPQVSNPLVGILGMFLSVLGVMAAMFLFIRLFGEIGGR